jgi:hypothetical protein
MSTRIELSGFNLNHLMGLSGSKNPQVLGPLMEATSDQPEVQAILRAAIEQGFRASGVDVEDGNHYSAAQRLAGAGQKHVGTDSNVWTAEALWDLELEDERAAELLAYLTEGRALFGNSIDAVPQTYGYLTLGEIKELLAFLPSPGEYSFTEMESDISVGYVEADEVDDFDICLATWLKAFADRKLDLWIAQT